VSTTGQQLSRQSPPPEKKTCRTHRFHVFARFAAFPQQPPALTPVPALSHRAIAGRMGVRLQHLVEVCAINR